MKKILFAIAVAGVSATAMTTAQAMPLDAPRDLNEPLVQIDYKCGPGWHVNPWGHCRPNRRPPRYGYGYGYGNGYDDAPPRRPRYGWRRPPPVEYGYRRAPAFYGSPYGY
jgi:hypothetical protein